MPHRCPDMRLTGATVLRDGAMQARSVAIEDGHVSKGPLPEVDLGGYYILPGIIDLHSSALVRHLGACAGTGFHLDQALGATDREAAAHGITTAWIGQGWSWAGGRDGPDFAETTLRALQDYRPRMKTDLRAQLRCETHTVASADRLIAAIDRHAVDYVMFTNHLDAALQTGRTPGLRDMPGPGAGAALDRARSEARAVPRHLCRLAEAFDQRGVIYGSHGDPDAETRETFSMIGAKLCEAPQTRAAAKLARAVNDPVLLQVSGAGPGDPATPGSSTQAIASGPCDALVAGNSQAALALAAFDLVRLGLRSLPEAWCLISRGPADIMRLPDRGVIDYGRRADLTIVRKSTLQVEATLVAGRITHLTGGAALRFLNPAGKLALAAE